MAGFLVVAMPILMLAFGGIETAHWMSLRQALSLTLMQTARVGITRKAEPRAIIQAFEDNLPLAYPGTATRRAPGQPGRNDTRPWHIRILSPLPDAFLDHTDPALTTTHTTGAPNTAGTLHIRNEGQARQHQANVARGWRDGRGPRSGRTIFEANTLALELYWPHRPILPGMRTLLRTLAPLAQDARTRQLLAAGYLPFRRYVALAMQSHPQAWPDPVDPRISYAQPGVVDAYLSSEEPQQADGTDQEAGARWPGETPAGPAPQTAPTQPPGQSSQAGTSGISDGPAGQDAVHPESPSRDLGLSDPPDAAWLAEEESAQNTPPPESC